MPPQIFSELLKLGFTKKDISQTTVSRYLRKIKANDPYTKKNRQSWRTFLKNHREVTAAMDFFVVPAFNFTVHYVFFIIHHDRRELVHFNVTKHPTAKWVIQQIREAFPFDSAPEYIIFDRDKIFSSRVKQFITDMGIKPKQTSYRSPWQNGVAER